MNATDEQDDDRIPKTSTAIESSEAQYFMSSSYREVQSILRNTEKGRSTLHGSSYHLRLTIMVILRAYKMHQLDNEFYFTVAMEVAAAGKFDDIMYHYSSPTLAAGFLFIQAKHKQYAGRDAKELKQNPTSEEPIQNKGSMIEADALCPAFDSTASFAIPMYFVSFLEVDQKLTNHARYILCTNAALHQNIRCYFKKIDPQQDKSLLFCKDIGATCYQFDRENQLPGLIDLVKDACLAKLGKECAQTIFDGKVMKFNDTIINTFVSLINECIEQETNDPSVSVFKFKEDFFNKDKHAESTPLGKFRRAFVKEHEILKRRKKTKHELKIQIDMNSFTSARGTRLDEDFEVKFNQKVHEFYDKFMLVCNSFNDENLHSQALTLLPQWCDADRGTIFDKLHEKLFNAMKKDRPVPIDLKFMQKCFSEVEPIQKINGLMISSNEYREILNQNHARVKLSPEHLKGSKLYAFLRDESSCGVFQYNSTLELSVSARIVDQTVSLLQFDTLFVDSTKYVKEQHMAAILDDLLAYLRDINHPTIKAITILGSPDHGLADEIKKRLKLYRQKIVVIMKLSESTQNDESFQRVEVKDLSDEASNQLYKQVDQKMFGTCTPLNKIVNETDDLSYLLDTLELCDQPSEIKDHNLNEANYERIKDFYVHRKIAKEEDHLDLDLDLDPLFEERARVALGHIDVEDVPPGVTDSDSKKVYIFLSEAGLGKTTYFTWLAWRLAISDPSLYVIKFNAVEYSTDFDRLISIDVDNFNDTDIVRLLYRYIHLALFVPINKCTTEAIDVVRHHADRCANLLTLSKDGIILDETKKNELSTKELIELRLFREKFNEQKLVLILDGFDEIAPHYNNAVMSCFARFARFDEVRSLYLSSRSYGFKEGLRETFDGCVMYWLKPYPWYSVVISLHKFLLLNVDDYKQIFNERRHFDVLANLFNSIAAVLYDIISVPLLLYMVQVVLLPEIRKRVKDNSHTISTHMLKDVRYDILYLVELFIERKIQLLISEKMGTTEAAGNIAAARSRNEKLAKKIRKRHILLALYATFDKNDREKLLSSSELQRARKIMKKVNKGDEKTGIVRGVNGGVPQFLHTTFAEYFTACWMFENLERLKSERIFRSKSLWSSSMKKTREFFNRLMLRDSVGCDLHWAVVDESVKQIEAIVRDNPAAITVKDKAGRSSLHLLDHEVRYKYLVINKTPIEVMNERDTLFGWNALDYAFVLENKSLASFLLNRGAQPNTDNLFEQLCSNDINTFIRMLFVYADYIFDNGDGTISYDKFWERVAIYLVREMNFDIYSPHDNFKSLSLLEYCLNQGQTIILTHLFTQSCQLGPVMDDRVHQLLQLTLEKKALGVTTCIIGHYPFLLAMINDDKVLYACMSFAINTKEMELFKMYFNKFTRIREIVCVEEEPTIEVFEDQGMVETFPFDVRPPHLGCCNRDGRYSMYRSKKDVSVTETILAKAVSDGTVQMISYILQKTNMVVTLELTGKIMQEIRNSDHEKSIAAFKYLFKKMCNSNGQEEQNLFTMIIKYGCLYMLPCVFEIGFDPNEINVTTHWDAFHYRVLHSDESSSAAMFLYLQKLSYVDCFETVGPTDKTIIDDAISESRFRIARVLVQDKFCNLSLSDKENAILDLLKKLLSEHEGKRIVEFVTTLYDLSSIRRIRVDEMWHPVYSSIRKRIPVV